MQSIEKYTVGASSALVGDGVEQHTFVMLSFRKMNLILPFFSLTL